MIQICDQKAAFLFAVVAAVIAYLHDCGAIRKALTDYHGLNSLTDISVLALLGSAAISLFVIAPRLSGSPSGLIFWQSIARFQNRSSYEDAVMSQSKASLMREQIGHCYELARICNKKFTLFRVSVWLAAIGLITALASVALSM